MVPRDAELESEISFRLTNPEALQRVLEVLWPVAGQLDVDDTCFELEAEALDTSLHLYGIGTTMSNRRRAKLCRGPRGLEAIFDAKSFVGEDKYETRAKRISTDRAVRRALEVFGPVIAALIKERLSLTYEFGSHTSDGYRRGHCVVSIDRLICFDPLALERHSQVHYHMEFEGDGLGGERLLHRSQLFRRAISPSVCELDDDNTKWRLAAAYCERPYSIAALSLAEVCDYYDKAASLLTMVVP